MTLDRCRECGGQVSTEAATCPHCGVQFPSGAKWWYEHRRRESRMAWLAAAIFAAVMVVMSAVDGTLDRSFQELAPALLLVGVRATLAGWLVGVLVKLGRRLGTRGSRHVGGG